jgi:hypothetical protein
MATLSVLEEPKAEPAPTVEPALAPEVKSQLEPEEAGMTCYLHKDRESESACSLCGNLICAECHVALAQHHLCKKCLAEAERVPAPFAPVAAPTPEAGEFSRKPSRFGHLAVPLIIGAVIGIAGANTTRREGIGMGMFLGAFAGLSVLIVGWIIASVIIPKDIQAERGGVLGALGISDYSEGLLYTTIVTVIFWVAIAG